MQIDLTCQFDSNHSIVGQNKAVLEQRGIGDPGEKRSLYPQNHDFRGFDEGSRNLSFFQPQFADRICCDHRGNLLAADRQRDLSHDSIDLDVDDTAN